METVIITGAIDSGKTSYCKRELVDAGGSGVCGLLSAKVKEEGITVGYDALEIGGRRRIPFARRPGREPSGWKETDRVGGFSVSQSGVAAANRWLAEALDASPRILIIDEVGPLEIRDGGLAASVRRCLAADPPGLTLYLVVRRDLLERVRAVFALEEARLLLLPGSRD